MTVMVRLTMHDYCDGEVHDEVDDDDDEVDEVDDAQ